MKPTNSVLIGSSDLGTPGLPDFKSKKSVGALDRRGQDPKMNPIEYVSSGGPKEPLSDAEKTTSDEPMSPPAQNYAAIMRRLASFFNKQ